MKNSTTKIVTAALLAALCCIATMVIKVPSPLNGYVNLGDCIVLLCGWVLSPMYGFLAAGIGACLADLFSGYVVFAPATFLIKGLMAFFAYHGVRLLSSKINKFSARLFTGIICEVFMVLGYYVFEGFLYGFIPSLVNIPANAVQGLVGIILALILIKIVEKNKLLSSL